MNLMCCAPIFFKRMETKTSIILIFSSLQRPAFLLDTLWGKGYFDQIFQVLPGAVKRESCEIQERTRRCNRG